MGYLVNEINARINDLPMPVAAEYRQNQNVMVS